MNHIRCKHPQIQRHSPHNRRSSPVPKRQRPLRLPNPPKRVSNTFVIRPLLHRQGPIGLHSHQCQISGRADQSAEAARRETGDGALGEGDGLVGAVLGGEVGEESVEEAHAGGCVGCLAEETGGEAFVEGGEGFVADDG